MPFSSSLSSPIRQPAGKEEAGEEGGREEVGYINASGYPAPRYEILHVPEILSTCWSNAELCGPPDCHFSRSRSAPKICRHSSSEAKEMPKLVPVLSPGGGVKV